MSRHQELLPIAERIYMRMQALDVLHLCLEEYTSNPMKEMLDQIIGDESPDLVLLSELLSDMKSLHLTLSERRFESRDRVVEVFRDGYELEIGEFSSPSGLIDYGALTSEGLLEHLAGQVKNLDKDEVLLLSELFAESTELFAKLSRQIHVIKALLGYLEDWLQALQIEIVREAPTSFENSNTNWMH